VSPRLVVLGALAFLGATYAVYGRWLARRVFVLDDDRPTPAVERQDGYDFVPTRPSVLLGHHFASIAGLGPIVGPAIAVIWGWFPAFLWIVVGAALVGAVHDFATLFLSIRHQGGSVGDITERLVNGRARVIFLAIIFFMLALGMGVFTHIIALLFSAPPGGQRYWPEAVLPSVTLMVVAMAAGYLTHKRGWPLRPVTAVAVAVMLFSVWAGLHLPAPAWSADDFKAPLLAYAFVASVLPVWLLLQPRDYINAFELYLGGTLLYAGFLWLGPSFQAPALNVAPADLPNLLPFLFITLACGACSGFHSLVSSGTTSKQLARESDALPVGFGSMLGEAALAVIVLMACACGVDDWHGHYASWAGASSLGAKLGAFVGGGSRFMAALGVPTDGAGSFIAVVIVSFALTTLDSATRLLSYVIEELVRAAGVERLPASRACSSLVAVLAIGYFAFMKIGGQPAGLALWQLFGVTNQLLAGLGLMIATVYLMRRKLPAWPTAVPMVFMFAISLWAIGLNLIDFAGAEGKSHLLIVGGLVTVLAVWLVGEAVVVMAAGLAPQSAGGDA